MLQGNPQLKKNYTKPTNQNSGSGMRKGGGRGRGRGGLGRWGFMRACVRASGEEKEGGGRESQFLFEICIMALFNVIRILHLAFMNNCHGNKITFKKNEKV